ncbi:MAG: hypothetical protein IKS07_05220 [Lachnospiraceae bacterium]|nr:hypothetical protein [Lachnospiraceae bacterium]MCR5476728.1 hypothetical protein [Lachnospiraceae bacterium]
MNERRFLQIYRMPAESFAKLWKLFLVIVFVAGLGIKGYQFYVEGGLHGVTRTVMAFAGAFAFEVLTILVYLTMRERSAQGYIRFLILYEAFVPHMSWAYLTRLRDLEFLSTMREDVVLRKWNAAFGFWAADAATYFQIMIPLLVLLFSALASEKIPRQDWILLGAAAGCMLMMFFFSGLLNLLHFVTSLILVYLIAKWWERVRRVISYEPMILLAWTELILFLALWMKGLVEALGW